MSEAVKNDWVRRVLGVTAGQRPSRGNSSEIGERMREAARALGVLRDVGAPEVADLSARLAQIGRSVEAGEDEKVTSAQLGALESDLARAASSARAREGGSPQGRGVAYVQMLLRWRAAQATLRDNLGALGRTLLARRDIQEDPRFDVIKQGVAALPKLVPEFGGELEDALDAGMSAADPMERERLERRAVAAIDAYCEQLSALAPILQLEKFATSELSTDLPLHSALLSALVELRQQLAV